MFQWLHKKAFPQGEMVSKNLIKTYYPFWNHRNHQSNTFSPHAAHGPSQEQQQQVKHNLSGPQKFELVMSYLLDVVHYC